jgi:hypothetical protein
MRLHPAIVVVSSMFALSAQALLPAFAAGPQVGAVARIQAYGGALRDGEIHRLGSGSAVHQGDELRTGKAGRLEVRLLDDTTITLGEAARVLIDDFVFDPARGVGAIAVDALAGSFRFVTGRLSTLRDMQFAIRTSFSHIGIRGTDFWAGPIRGVYGVLLVDGAIDVTAAGITRSLDTAGSGVDIAAPGAPPGPVVQWSTEKTAEALSSVAFTQ